MKIKNIEKVKELLKLKLPEYLREQSLKIENTKVQCPHKEAHDHGDLKLSAAFLPDSNNSHIYCFVENRIFDIFDVYSLVTGKNLVGEEFYQVIEELAKKYGIPLEYEEEYSLKEKEKRAQQRVLEELHRLSLEYVKKTPQEALPLYQQRRLNADKIQYWKIGYLRPEFIPVKLIDEYNRLHDYKLKSVFRYPSLVIPVLNQNKQYTGLILRQFGSTEEDKYLKLIVKDAQPLFNIQNTRGNDKLTIVEGPIDCISLYPEPNVVSCLTNVITDDALEILAKAKFKNITLALDPDNLYKGKARDGFLRSILKLKNLDTELKLVEIPKGGDKKPDPDEFMKTHTLDDFKNLPRMDALNYLIENYKRNIIPVEILYDYVAGCPNLIRREQMVLDVAKALNIGKRQLMKSIDNVSSKDSSFNLIQYAEEKDSFEELLEGFTETAWNQQYKGLPSGYPLFDKNVGGFEDTLYLMIGFPEMGKTTILLNFAYKLARNPNHYVAFYSLDDGARRSIIPRLFSMVSGLTSKQIKQPSKDIEPQWQNGLKAMQALKENLVIKDGSDIRTLQDLDSYIKIHSCIAKEKEKKLIIIIDNLHDLSAGAKRELESTQNAQRVASYLKRLPQSLNCPIIATAEVPKSSESVPTGKDIKESIDLWYAARFVAGIFSDFHNEKKKYSHLIWVTPVGDHQPIIEILISKNQTGESWHGSLYYKFNLKDNTLIECRQEEIELLRKGQSIT